MTAAADLRYELAACRAARAAIDTRIAEITAEIAAEPAALDENFACSLWDLVAGLDWSSRLPGRPGRPLTKLDEVVFGLCWKAHTGKSLRATVEDLAVLWADDIIPFVLHHNAIQRYKHSPLLAAELREFLECVVEGDPPETEARCLLTERYAKTRTKIAALCMATLAVAREMHRDRMALQELADKTCTMQPSRENNEQTEADHTPRR